MALQTQMDKIHKKTDGVSGSASSTASSAVDEIVLGSPTGENDEQQCLDGSPQQHVLDGALAHRTQWLKTTALEGQHQTPVKQQHQSSSRSPPMGSPPTPSTRTRSRDSVHSTIVTPKYFERPEYGTGLDDAEHDDESSVGSDDDTSDEAYFARHVQLEIQERGRYSVKMEPFAVPTEELASSTSLETIASPTVQKRIPTLTVKHTLLPVEMCNPTSKRTNSRDEQVSDTKDRLESLSANYFDSPPPRTRRHNNDEWDYGNDEYFKVLHFRQTLAEQHKKRVQQSLFQSSELDSEQSVLKRIKPMDSTDHTWTCQRPIATDGARPTLKLIIKKVF